MTTTLSVSKSLAISCVLISCLTVNHTVNAQSPEQEAAIREHRMGTMIISATPNATVQVRQLRHEFWFGSALANHVFDGAVSREDAVSYRQVFLDNFNSAVTESALKWGVMEPKRGEVDYLTIDAILEFTDQHVIPLRGHNIFWGVPKWTQDWVKELDDEALRATVEARARDIGSRYRGRFAEYDLNNEMIHGNVFEDRLGPEITLNMAQWLKDQDPGAKLYLNDYDILTGAKLGQYVTHIRDLLEMGVPIDGIGVQGHLHAETFDPEALQNALDELAKFGLPIRVTEFSMPGQRSKYYENRAMEITPEEELSKAQLLVDYYRICFAHPAVNGILMWGFWEGANWIPQSSLYKRDWSPTPAAQAYKDLVYGEWWTNGEVKADGNGRVEIQAFFGLYTVISGDEAVTVELKKEDRNLTVMMP